MWDIGKHNKGAGIRHKAKLSNRPHALDGCQAIHAREGLHGERLANALAQALRQAVDVCGFATNDATVVTVHEADQAYVRFCRTLENGMCVHWNLLGHARVIAATLAVGHTVRRRCVHLLRPAALSQVIDRLLRGQLYAKYTGEDNETTGCSCRGDWRQYRHWLRCREASAPGRR